MLPDGQRRLLAAATAEFAQRGLAGARVARIAAEAKANKQLIYAYFGDKDGLFDAVIADRYTELTEAVPMDPYDLVGWVLSQFDYITANPEIMRLAEWQELERPEDVPNNIDVHYKPFVEVVAKAQREGKVSAEIPALDLIVMLAGLAASWHAAFSSRHALANDKAWSTRLLNRHREALRHAAERLVSP